MLSHLREKVGTGVTNGPFLEYPNEVYERSATASCGTLAAAYCVGLAPSAEWWIGLGRGCVMWNEIK